VTIIAFLLCSFTLLGFEPGKPASTLALHLNKQGPTTAGLRSELRNVLGGEHCESHSREDTRVLPGGAGMFDHLGIVSTGHRKL